MEDIAHVPNIKSPLLGENYQPSKKCSTRRRGSVLDFRSRSDSCRKNRRQSAPDVHQGFDNDGCDEVQERDLETTQEKVHRVSIETDVIDALNDVSSWNMNDIFTNYQETGKQRKPAKVQESLVFGAENVIHLPVNCQQIDRFVFLKQRNTRRHAVHIYDADNFAKIFKQFLQLVRAQSYELL